MRAQIRKRVLEAYLRMGVNSPQERNRRVREALIYLNMDRQRYIEAVESDTPDYLVTIRQGKICQLIPLGRRVITDQEKDYLQIFTATLYLMVTEEEARYVIGYDRRKEYEDPRKNSYVFPVYRYTQPEDITDDFTPDSPQQLVPSASKKDRQIFSMAFWAMDRFCKHLAINFIPHNAEQAALAAEYALPETIAVDGKTVTGKLVPLASQRSMWSQQREDHRYSCQKNLYLFITESSVEYVMKTLHHYEYFRKVVYDDVPGGCAYEHTEEKHEVEYKTVTLADIAEDLYPHYH